MRRAREHTLPEGLPRSARRLLAAGLAAAFLAGGPLASDAVAEDWETPQTRLRPIGAPSAVDAFPRSEHFPQAGNPPRTLPSPQHAAVPHAAVPHAAVPHAAVPHAAVPSAAVRQAAMMQASEPLRMPMPTATQEGTAPSGAPALPAPLSSSPALGPIAPSPAQTNTTPLPRPAVSPLSQGATAPHVGPGSGQAVSPPSLTPVPASDYAPLAQPQLEQPFAALGNCRNISAPSSYRSDRILTCAPPASYVTTVGASAPPPSYLPPPAQLGPPATLPPTVAAPGAIPLATAPAVLPGAAGHRPLISFGQENYPVQVGQGIFGQPTAYVPGQTVRNAIRYFTW